MGPKLIDHEVEKSSTTEGLPVAPSFGPELQSVNAPRTVTVVGKRVVFISALACVVAVLAGFVAQLLSHLIGLITNLAWFGQWSTELRSPAGNDRGWWTLLIPVVGGVVVGLMARYGSRAIRGHGIPEAMEQVLLNRSRIPARMTFLKPLSAAVSIGTGGPFGAEGPIIATGGSLGSLLGQWIKVTDEERKTLLASGAAAGMAATFGSPVSAVLLAVELLLFEYRARSVIPVALAASAATAVRWTFEGNHPVFPMPNVLTPTFGSLWLYIAIGALLGVASVGVTRAVYWIEDLFEKLPIHWMWWPALGGIAVGAFGILEPRTLGVGYENIARLLQNDTVTLSLAIFGVLKFASWSIALGSGTSGGTLAPLLTIGGSLGAFLGAGIHRLLPAAAMDPRVAALVGMAALFAGSSRALLASVVFAFEVTLQPVGLLPLLGGCGASYLVSALLMRHSIMTEKIARRGVRVPSEYTADYLDRVLVGAFASKDVVALRPAQTLEEVRQWIVSGVDGTAHQGFPVVDERGNALGVLTRRDLFGAEPPTVMLRELIRRPAAVVYADNSLREAADHMVRENIGRLLVVERSAPSRPIGIITRSDLLRAHQGRLTAETEQTGRIGFPLSGSNEG